MDKAQELSENAIRRIWKQHNRKPVGPKTFRLRGDPQFIEKLTAIGGLYLNPPDKTLVLYVVEKRRIRALDRTQPGLPMKQGRAGTVTHNYKRDGTAAFVVGLSMLDGELIEGCLPRHRHQEVVRFLNKTDDETYAGVDLHLIIDTCGTRKHPRVKAWLKRRPPFHFRFTPTSGSWLNMVERWFRDLADNRIRRG